MIKAQHWRGPVSTLGPGTWASRATAGAGEMSGRRARGLADTNATRA